MAKTEKDMETGW